MLEQLAHVRAVSRIQAHADAAGGLQRVLIDDDRLVQAIVDALGTERDLVVRLDVLEYHHELIAAHADDHVALPHACLQAPRDFLQELVAGLMSARVVDVLEAVEIEKDHAQHLIRVACLVDGLGQEGGEIMAVGQPGQLIVMRHAIEPLLIVDELLLGLAPDRHIVRHIGKTVAAVGLQPVAADFDIDLRAAPCNAAAS